MRLQVMSDLHLEFHRDRGASFLDALVVDADVLVLAGDIVPLMAPADARHAFEAFSAKARDVVFLPGNHEYYGLSPDRAHAALEVATRGLTNVHVLNPGLVELHGVRILGAPLWFPLTPDEERYRMYVNDFRAIGRFVPWVHETNAAHVAFLAENMRRGDVVVTHHLPHPRSVDAQYAGEPSNRFFLAANAAPLVEAGLAQLWIHGHTHLPCDYVEHGTRVVCNPLGYPAERKPPYDPAFVIEVGSQHVER